MKSVPVKTPRDWNKNVESFVHTCESNIKREGFGKFLDYLAKHTDFFKAPVNAHGHYCYEGGLLQYSLDVYSRLYSLLVDELRRDGQMNSISKEDTDKVMESLAIVGLLHACCDANAWIPIPDDEGAGYRYIPQMAYGRGAKSVILMEKYFRLKQDETSAILFWDNEASTNSDAPHAYNACKLAVFTRMAVFAATYIDGAVAVESPVTYGKDAESFNAVGAARASYAKLCEEYEKRKAEEANQAQAGAPA